MFMRTRVEVTGASDVPIDSLQYNKQYAGQNAGVRMFPTFRPDKVYAIENVKSWIEYVETLERAAGKPIKSYADLLSALQTRVDYFDSLGCRASDHGLEHIYFEHDAEDRAADIFATLRGGKELSLPDQHTFKSAVLIALGRMYHAKGWAQQFHVGALRN